MGKKGFTLIELIIVIAIIGILAGIAIPGYIGQQKRATKTEAFSNLENLRLLEEQFYAENGRYAPDPDGTVNYAPGDTSITISLPGFRPGAATDLNFSYQVVTLNNGTQFTATATGRAGTRVAGETYTIDQNNTRNF